MKQYTELLEKNVEWLALAIGGIFLLLVVWAYIIVPPATAKIGAQSYPLGEVDQQILRGPASQLRLAIEQPGKTNLNFPEVVSIFRNEMANQGLPSAATLSPYVSSFGGSSGPAVDTSATAEQLVWVTELAQLPAPQPVTVTHEGNNQPIQLISKGVSEVLLPPIDPNQKYPDLNSPNPQPRMQVSLTADTAKKVDRLWATLLYQVDIGAITAALTKAQYYTVLDDQPLTAFLRIETERQELLSDGQWGQATAVPLLEMDELPPLPDGTDPELAHKYVDWAATNALLVLKPPFYSTVGGVQWSKPADTSAVTTEQPRRPGQMTREEYRAYLEEKKKERETRAPRTNDRDMMVPPDMPGMPGTSRSRSRSTTPARRERTERPTPRTQPRTPAAAPAMNPRLADMQALQGQLPPGMAGMPGMPGTPGMPGMPSQIYPGQQPGNTLEPEAVIGRFVPESSAPDVELWVHDENLQAGKTYRYRVRYVMLNPIYDMINSSKPESLQDVFTLTSPWSDWSTPIVMNSLSQYYVSGTSPRGESTSFDIFKWEGGGWHQTRFDNVRPGDVIGNEKTIYGQKMDFSTGSTLVDIRYTGPNRDPSVIIMDPQGNLTTRDQRTDQNDAMRRELQQKANENRQQTQNPTANPMIPGPGGVPNMPPPTPQRLR